MDQSVGSPREFSAGDFVKAMIIEGYRYVSPKGELRDYGTKVLGK